MRLEVWSQAIQCELGCIPQLIAEESVALNAQNIKVDITACQQNILAVFHLSTKGKNLSHFVMLSALF